MYGGYLLVNKIVLAHFRLYLPELEPNFTKISLNNLNNNPYRILKKLKIEFEATLQKTLNIPRLKKKKKKLRYIMKQTQLKSN